MEKSSDEKKTKTKYEKGIRVESEEEIRNWERI
jgi:hypothetical protein